MSSRSAALASAASVLLVVCGIGVAASLIGGPDSRSPVAGHDSEPAPPPPLTDRTLQALDRFSGIKATPDVDATREGADDAAEALESVRESFGFSQSSTSVAASVAVVEGIGNEELNGSKLWCVYLTSVEVPVHVGKEVSDMLVLVDRETLE
jgi:hypothetical protein